MRQLTVVAISDDGTHVLLAGGADVTKPTHQVAIDDRLAAAVRGELDEGPRRESALSPKEIQARLRSGDTPEQVAKAASVPVNRVLRFFGPVASERERILSQAQAATMRRTRGPQATMPLGEAVERRLATATGLRRETVEWSAKRREDGGWVVALSYSARGGLRTASWLWQPAQRDLTALDVAATRIAIEDSAPSTPAHPTVRSPRKRAARTTRPARSPAATPAAVPEEPEAAPPSPDVAPPAPDPAPRVRREPKVIAPPRTRTGRVPVPSWDDVLFGAIPTSDTTTADEPRADAPDVDAQDGSAPARRRRS